MAVNGNYGANPNYPSSYRGMTYKPVKPTNQHEQWAGAAVSFLSEVTPEDYVQAKGLWEVLGRTPGQQDNFISNVAGHLAAAKEDTRKRTYEMFSKVDKELGAKIEEATEKDAPAPTSQAAGSAQSRL
jgi:catalase